PGSPPSTRRSPIWPATSPLISSPDGMHPAHRPARTPVQVPVNLDQYRVRKHVHAGGLINEYRLIA
ncbi:MAG: hypothetical protein ACLP5E_03425, partial [Streptosporangiaceae bacterium]